MYGEKVMTQKQNAIALPKPGDKVFVLLPDYEKEIAWTERADTETLLAALETAATLGSLVRMVTYSAGSYNGSHNPHRRRVF